MSFVPDKELGMLVHAHNPKTDKGTNDSRERVQSMQSYGMDDWESWKDYIEPHHCLMQHRTGDMYNSKSCVLSIMCECSSCAAYCTAPSLDVTTAADDRLNVQGCQHAFRCKAQICVLTVKQVGLGTAVFGSSGLSQYDPADLTV